MSRRNVFRPQRYSGQSAIDRSALDRLRRQHPHLTTIDSLAEQLSELDEIDHPELLGSRRPAPTVGPNDGVWVYYPWRATLVRILPEADYFRLRSSRNQHLITAAEQRQLRDVRVAVAGLNVGNPAALCLALESGANTMRFADFDTLSVTNLNRFRAGLPDIGMNKAILSARQVYEMNPYAEIDVWDEGLGQGREAAFLDDIDVVVEEMDNLLLKLSLRAAARQRRLPVVMVTGNGANVVVDIERFDLDPDLPTLNGHLPERVKLAVAGPPPAKVVDQAALARDFMGPGTLVPRLLQSFDEISRTLAGIPQLAESSFLRGAAVCYVVRQIATGAPAPSGRYHIKLDEIFS